jgi:hypothetical protein
MRHLRNARSAWFRSSLSVFAAIRSNLLSIAENVDCLSGSFQLQASLEDPTVLMESRPVNLHRQPEKLL